MVKIVKMSQCAASKLHVLSEEPFNKSSSTDRRDNVVEIHVGLTDALGSKPGPVQPDQKRKANSVSISCI